MPTFRERITRLSEIKNFFSSEGSKMNSFSINDKGEIVLGNISVNEDGEQLALMEDGSQVSFGTRAKIKYFFNPETMELTVKYASGHIQNYTVDLSVFSEEQIKSLIVNAIKGIAANRTSTLPLVAFKKDVTTEIVTDPETGKSTSKTVEVENKNEIEFPLPEAIFQILSEILSGKLKVPNDNSVSLSDQEVKFLVSAKIISNGITEGLAKKVPELTNIDVGHLVYINLSNLDDPVNATALEFYRNWDRKTKLSYGKNLYFANAYGAWVRSEEDYAQALGKFQKILEQMI